MTLLPGPLKRYRLPEADPSTVIPVFPLYSKYIAEDLLVLGGLETPGELTCLVAGRFICNPG
jgi:hypothetical protein